MIERDRGKRTHKNLKDKGIGIIIYYIYNFLYIIVFRIAYMPFGAIVLTLRFGVFLRFC